MSIILVLWRADHEFKANLHGSFQARAYKTHTHTKAKQTKIKGKKVCKTAKQARCLPCKPDNLV